MGYVDQFFQFLRVTIATEIDKAYKSECECVITIHFKIQIGRFFLHKQIGKEILTFWYRDLNLFLGFLSCYGNLPRSSIEGCNLVTEAGIVGMLHYSHQLDSIVTCNMTWH